MSRQQPDNVIFIVADILRYDLVMRQGASSVPYMSSNGAAFTQACSAGCWTLPATASMFTGLLCPMSTVQPARLEMLIKAGPALLSS